MTPDHPALSGSLCEARDLAAHVRSIALEAVPARQGPFKGSVLNIDLDGVTLEIVHSDPVLLLGQAAEDQSGFLLMLDGKVKWNGASVGGGQVALFGDGCPIAIASRAALNCALVSFNGSEAGGPLPPCERRLWQDRSVPVMQVDGRAHAQLAAFACAAEQISLSNEGIPGHAETLHAQRASFQDEVRNLFAPLQRNVPQRRSRPFLRVQIVRKADDYLQANPARPIYTDELCAALGVSASCLHGAFETTLGISPHRYLKLRRMTMVRAMLLSGSTPWHSVKAAALSHGFWHLGQFAHDYRSLFGESPSETLIRAQ
ncbi:helix-turn-helix domain-containing protein [Teichococcus oryzae]|nr:helix-turn-helix domain-containing protein [Pseudoroseomonas oryzae]